MRQTIERGGGRAVPVVCDLSDLASVGRAAAEIIALGLPIGGPGQQRGHHADRAHQERAGLGHDVRDQPPRAVRADRGAGAAAAGRGKVVFVCSGVEDPERRPAVMAGFRGGRYISAEASARGEWKPGGSKLPGGDAYATAKQCNLATVLAFARETPRLRFNAVEPGFSPATDLSRDSNVFLRALGKYVLSPLAPLHQVLEHPERRPGDHQRAERVGRTGVYYDERGQPMLGSTRYATRSSKIAWWPRPAPCWRGPLSEPVEPEAVRRGQLGWVIENYDSLIASLCGRLAIKHLGSVVLT